MPDLVTVYCSLPHGLHLRLFDWIVDVAGAKVAQPRGPGVVLNGSGALSFGAVPSVAPGCGLTEGVDKAYLNEWLEQSAEMGRHVYIDGKG